MNDLDLDARLERLAATAARDARVPDLEAVVDAFCRSRRTGDCAEGVAMVVAYPRR